MMLMRTAAGPSSLWNCWKGNVPSGGGTPIQLTSDHGQSWPCGWSPDGDKIAFAGLRNGVWNIWWVSRRDKTEKQIAHYSKLNSYVRYPADRHAAIKSSTNTPKPPETSG
jgi:Tol biopolymer transport system component